MKKQKFSRYNISISHIISRKQPSGGVLHVLWLLPFFRDYHIFGHIRFLVIEFCNMRQKIKSVLQNFCQNMLFSTVRFLKKRLFKMCMLDSLTLEVLSNRGYDFLGFCYVYKPIKSFTKEGLNSIFPIFFIR